MSSFDREVTLPHHWWPRDYQMPAWDALQSGVRFLDLCWHRRAGKDLFSINWISRAAMRRPGVYWHVLPTYAQGRKIVWDGVTREGRPFLSHFPEELVWRKREDQMSVWLEGGSLYQVVGADKPDTLVGANPFGVVFSEWSLMSRTVLDLIWPILAENGGWAIFIYTPRGRNHAYKQRQKAVRNKNWFTQKLTVDDTHAVALEEIQRLREDGMPEELIQQEFYCSFDAPLVGSYYGDILMRAREGGRIGKVPWEPRLEVSTFWDLGIADTTAIWFHQHHGREHRLIDFYHSSGVGIEHYVKILREKPYVFREAVVPHDAMARELSTGKSRLEIMRELGLRVRVAPKLPIADGISATRQMLEQTWVDETRCEYGLQALSEYTKEETGERGPDGIPIYRDKPLHNWASHPADALRTGAVGWMPKPRGWDKPITPRIPIA